MKSLPRAAPAVFAALVVLAACGGTPTATTGGLGNGAAVTPTPSHAAQPPFTLEDGFEHDVCGIGLIVRFIPSSSTATSADEAVLEGGPVSHVQDNVQDHTGDQPLPSNAAKLDVDTTVTVVGKSFHVTGIDLANSKIQLQPLC